MLLEARGVQKSYGGVRALKGVSLEVCAGEIHALVGENGAGKSTLIKILSGAVQPDAGEILLDGQAVKIADPLAAKALGIIVIYQQPALFPELSVAENIAFALEKPMVWRKVDWAGRRRVARELLERVGSSIDPDTPVKQLSMPEQQIVEIAKALGLRSRVLILDEPTASLTENEVERLFRILGDLREQGVGIVYISHRLEELFRLADRVTVLRDGSYIVTRSMKDVDQPELLRLMVGRDLSAVFPKHSVHLGDPLLELRRYACSRRGVRDVNLTLRAGEIVGLAGLVGSGRTELAESLFGLTPGDQGEMRIGGQQVALRTAGEAIAHGLAYVPEDRRRHGVIPEMSVGANLTLAELPHLANSGFLDNAREESLVIELMQSLQVKAESPSTPAIQLSGGNQQKVALGRWLATKPRILILDEPTQGVDVGAKAEIHRLMGELAAQGMGILMISSELPEILGMSDRILVMRRGTVAAEFRRDEASEHAILSAAFGSAP